VKVRSLNSTENSTEPTPLHLLTTEVVLNELVSGRSVEITGRSDVQFDDCDTRNVLEWYRANTEKWVKNLSAGDVDAIVDRIDEEPPAFEAFSSAPQNGAKKKLSLRKVTAHRFGGLHSFGKVLEPPEDFTIDFTDNVTLLEGANGSGKTSVLNAIVWCLTGHLLRSQREPEQGPTEFECEIQLSDGNPNRNQMSAITPMPDSEELPTDGSPVTADSWVELLFYDEDGSQLPPVRRSQSRTARGKIEENQPNLGSLGLDPIAWRIATTMPALLQYLSVGSASQLGHAVARLTGLADLVDLSKHAQKASERLDKRSIKELETVCQQISEHYDEAASDMGQIAEENSELELEFDLPKIENDDCTEILEAIENKLETIKSDAFQDAKDVLGKDFDPEDRSSREELEKQVHPARHDLGSIKELPSMARAIAMMGVEDAQEETARVLLSELKSEATILDELLRTPDVAVRSQLYARVANWFMINKQELDDNCPVCAHSLLDRVDPVTGKNVSDHIKEAREDSNLLSKSIAEWADHWTGRLANELVQTLSSELKSELPGNPTELVTKAYVEELFEKESYGGVLKKLQAGTKEAVVEESSSLPQYVPSEPLELPYAISANASELVLSINRLVAALGFVSWFKAHRTNLRAFSIAVTKGDDALGAANPALGAKLELLLTVVDGAAPLNEAITRVKRLKTQRNNYKLKRDRIGACKKAAIGCLNLVQLGVLAQAQVEELRNRLEGRTEFWRSLVYQNATTFAPILTSTEMDAKGALGLKVGRLGVEGPAQHLSNASALRGSLLGFFLAFREHVLSLRGGLHLLILDDPQDLLDNDNRARLARGLSTLAEQGAQIVATTHDKHFARVFVQENRSGQRVRHLSVHPVNTDRPVLRLSPSVEEVDRKKEEYKNNKDSDRHAQDYASDLRVFLEARIGDLFDGSVNPAYANPTKAPTLIPLLDKLKSVINNNAGELFSNPVVKSFASHPALQNGAEARRILNESHHDKTSIRYQDVVAVEAEFANLRSEIENVHQQFRFYRFREPLSQDTASPSENIVALPKMNTPTFAVPVCPDLAAFTAGAVGENSQEIIGEKLDSDFFDDKALYYVRGETLGFAAPSGSVIIVECEPYSGKDQNLVLAKFGDAVFARRMFASRDATGISLVAEMPDPRTRRKTLTFDPTKLRVFKIVGAVFSSMPPPQGKHEAINVEAVPELQTVEIAYRVREDSAVPLALPGQIVLGGPPLQLGDLSNSEGKIVAVTLEDGRSLLKRVGAQIAEYLWQFETIGGLGASIVATIGPATNIGHLPTIASARPVIGVLYDT